MKYPVTVSVSSLPCGGLPASEGMKYYDFAKRLTEKYDQPLISILPKLNLAVWELKGCNSGVIDDTDIVPLEKIIERMISMDSLEGLAVLGSGSPCPDTLVPGQKGMNSRFWPGDAFRREISISEQMRNQSSQIHSASQGNPGRKGQSKCFTLLSSLVTWARNRKCAIRHPARP